MKKTCPYCKKDKFISDFSPKASYCKKCSSKRSLIYHYKNRDKELSKMREYQQINRSKRTEYFRKYRKTKSGSANTSKAVKKYELNNTDRRNAWNKSKIIPLKPCEICGDIKTHRHHPDISKPMEIIFLCPKHHKEVEKSGIITAYTAK